MPLYDFECTNCGNIDERIEHYDVDTAPCSKCSCKAKRIISVNGPNCANEDAGWLSSVLEVVDKESDLPHTREFLKNPTRSNYKAWMKERNLRPFEPGEERKMKPDPPNFERLGNKLWEEHRKRNRLEVRSR